MGRIIPNANTWVGFAPTVANISAPTVAEIGAGKNLTGYVISINAAAQGNTVPTPAFDSLFETNIPGTTSASFSADFYRDNTTGVNGDLAWKTLPRATAGYFIISRFGGTDGSVPNRPTTGNTCEVWPVLVVSRTMANMSNNTVMTFTVTASVPQQPNEAAVVA